jgi:hypothetical protein
VKKATYSMIVDSIKESIDVEMCGQDKFIGKCPFHSDKEDDAKIIINTATYSYECTSCGSCGPFYNAVLSLKITEDMRDKIIKADVIHQVFEISSGAVRALLRHCVIASIEDDIVELLFDKEQEPLLTPKIISKIKECFAKAMKKDITLLVRASGKTICQ